MPARTALSYPGAGRCLDPAATTLVVRRRRNVTWPLTEEERLLGATAREFAEREVAPGAVETEMLRQVLTREQFPTEKTMDPSDVALVIAQCIAGDLRYTSGEVIFLHKTM